MDGGQIGLSSNVANKKIETLLGVWMKENLPFSTIHSRLRMKLKQDGHFFAGLERAGGALDCQLVLSYYPQEDGTNLHKQIVPESQVYRIKNPLRDW